jgi:aldehyde:ferredoxin oxidoreductase
MAEKHGYAGRILEVDLSSGNITSRPTTDYANAFLGCRGIGTKIYWDEMPPEAKAFDPENRLIFITGPATGVPPAGSICQIYGKSPITNPQGFCYSTMTGKGWGAHLKFAGFDGVIIQGKSEKPVYLLVRDGAAEIRDASVLWGRSTVEVQETLKRELGGQVRVVATGLAGENMVSFASLLADGDASGSSGFGAVMGSKKLKAIAVTGSGKIVPASRPKLQELTKYIRWLVGNRPQITMVALPPSHTHKACFACIGCNSRSFYKAENGTEGKYTCGSGMVYQDFAQAYYGRRTEVPFFAERLCDQYGLDAYAMLSTLILLAACSQAGTITEESTGLPLSKLGSLEFIEALVKKIALREGFGDVLAQGPVMAADSLGEVARAIADTFISDPLGHVSVFCPRMIPSTALAYAMEPRQHIPQVAELGGPVEAEWSRWARKAPGAYVSSDVIRAIAKRFWGSELAVDFSTYEGKALAAKKVQDRVFGNECVPLCFWMFTGATWHSEFTEGHIGDPTIESQILSAVTGKEVDEEGLYRMGEKVFNLQRAIMVREGRRGRESDRLPEIFHTQPLVTEAYDPECLVPGKDGEIISRQGELIDRQKFEKMKDDFYALRGWDVATGLQTKAKLAELGLRDVAEDLGVRGLVV